ncbi:hypothetical protein IWW39_003375, partial [Coemansia spiralis]
PHLPTDLDAASPATELALHDGSRAKVPSAGLHKAMSIFIFAHLDVLADAYRLEHGCLLTQCGDILSKTRQKLGELKGVECWEPWQVVRTWQEVQTLLFLQQIDDERGSLGCGVLAQLGLTYDLDKAILALVLCRTLAATCGTWVDQLLGPFLVGIFRLVTGLDIQSLWVVTGAGIKVTTWCQICDMLLEWVDGVANLLAKAAACTNPYKRQCTRRLGSMMIDLGSHIAQGLLADDASESQLLLGIGQAELKVLAACLALIVSKDMSPHMRDNLLHLLEESSRFY